LLSPFADGNPYEAYHLTHHRHTMPELHSHDLYEFYFFLSGDISIVIEEYSYRTCPGDVFIFPPGHMHRAHHLSEHSYYDRFFCYVPVDHLRHISTNDYPLLSIVEAAVQKGVLRVHPPDKEFNQTLAQLNDVIVTATDADAAQRRINDCLMTMLLVQLSRWFAGQASAGDSHTSHFLTDVIVYINANLEKDLSLDTLANSFFINKYHLLREFKSYAQVTLYQYILQKRITQAKALLRAHMPASQVCVQCGFNDYSSFYKAFKKQTLMSPQEYADFTAVPADAETAFVPFRGG
jgi:AraC-like DNA-binding protein